MFLISLEHLHGGDSWLGFSTKDTCLVGYSLSVISSSRTLDLSVLPGSCKLAEIGLDGIPFVSKKHKFSVLFTIAKK